MSLKFKGKILHIGEVQEVGAKGYKKVEFVVEEHEGEYPNSICLTIFGAERVGMILDFKVGDLTTVLYNSKATEYNEKRFTNSTVWQMHKSKSDLDKALGDSEADETPF